MNTPCSASAGLKRFHILSAYLRYCTLRLCEDIFIRTAERDIRYYQTADILKTAAGTDGYIGHIRSINISAVYILHNARIIGLLATELDISIFKHGDNEYVHVRIIAA